MRVGEGRAGRTGLTISGDKTAPAAAVVEPILVQPGDIEVINWSGRMQTWNFGM
jgi:hypothetical protein